ncbi:helix-turn-helix transcriptional regulator [Paraclostridium sordellii]|uniref:helix-turn-helix transcriptional regulator n=1 Tax=Paraclostridium sordellii TaxID=1505 RepID=UPI0005E90A7E|nr:helix-turn-helix transcriptional regulator [Paeniclostridium sordellii]MCQ4696529.1 helix-turn-helix transcriptional regulator [Paeniclostridium sordellii]MDU6482366.1 helix-turn-helix transcriptional regulator [Paeniclostridium sordellii]CEN84262.1 transcriptional regulator [[Clostridium] sordellii] [Paeniclostridium sordellii]CEO09425.1 transcriptional regulator [[Clostridium] sordellii] [Paeniclostridium sordellii]CEO23672.1 transcriptional regulator [[Clostridium] sordellii] [Paeniclost
MNDLKKLRKKIKVTQKDVARNIGITTSYYGMIETGVRAPSLSTAIKLSKYFGLPVEKILKK